jgi:hypothetical protein
MGTFRKVVKAEIDEFGPIPRNMFMSEYELVTYRSRIKNAVRDLESTALLESSFAESIRHRLVMYVRKVGLGPPFSYNSSDYTLDWISKPIFTKATEIFVKGHLKDLDTNYFSALVGIAPQLDRKHIERLLVFCVAAKPNNFKIELRSDVSFSSRVRG